MGVTLTGRHDDPIDRLMFLTQGEVLRVGHEVTGGEYDSYRAGQVSVRTARRLAAAGLVSRVGLEADRLQHVVACRWPTAGGWNADQLVEWYVGEALAGLDLRAGWRAGAVEERPEPDPCERGRWLVAGRPAGRFVTAGGVR